MTTNTPRYDRVAVFLHWAVAIGIVAIGTTELVRHEFLPKGNVVREILKAVHAPAGTVMFALILFRMVWRATHKAPALPAGMRTWEQAAAKLAHSTLYAMMLALPALGVAAMFAAGKPIDFGLFQIAYPLNDLFGRNLAGGIKSTHQFLGQAILAAGFVHAAAALWHHYVRRDGVLERMLPAARQAA